MFRKCLAGLAAVAVIAVLVYAGPPDEGAGKLVKVEDGDFAGKIVAVEVADPEKAVYLSDVHIKRLGDRAFLVGRFAAHNDELKLPEIAYWFPVNDLRTLTVFNSIDDARKVYAAQEANEKQ